MDALKVSAEEKEASVPRAVDSSELNRRVFLVKVPKYFAESWKSLEPGAEIGRMLIPEIVLQLHKQEDSFGNQTETVQARKRRREEEGVRLRGAQGGKFTITNSAFPLACREHNLLFSGVPDTSYCFLENERHDIVLDGTISQRWDVTPVMTPEYRNYCRQRDMKGNEKTKETKFEKDVDPIKTRLAAPKKPKMKEIVKEKKTRMERSDLVDMLLSCFERQPLWSWNDLLQHTQQPGVRSLLNLLRYC
jgi:hypothetical protein